jgi:hypothetical protein
MAKLSVVDKTISKLISAIYRRPTKSPQRLSGAGGSFSVGNPPPESGGGISIYTVKLEKSRAISRLRCFLHRGVSAASEKRRLLQATYSHRVATTATVKRQASLLPEAASPLLYGCYTKVAG